MPERITRPTLLVVQALLDAHRDGRWTWGFEICSSTGLKTGTIYPVLARLEGDAWVEARWDDGERPGPRRRLYRLTSSGAADSARLVAERSTATGSVLWGPA